jgi:hypothetical protein
MAITVRIYLAGEGSPEDPLQDAEFLAMPRVGDHIVMRLKDGEERYRVTSVEHEIRGTEPADPAVAVERA